MSFPAYNPEGDLPAGLWPATLSETVLQFGSGSTQRQIIAARLERIWALAKATGHLARFVVFGSFVTETPHPRDVDLVLVMDDAFDVSALTGDMRIVFDHSAADAYFGASIFWMRRLSTFGGEDAMIGQWQLKRDGGMRGIVEITGP